MPLLLFLINFSSSSVGQVPTCLTPLKLLVLVCPQRILELIFIRHRGMFLCVSFRSQTNFFRLKWIDAANATTSSKLVSYTGKSSFLFIFCTPHNLFCDSITVWGLVSWEKTEGWRSCGGSRWEYLHWDLIIPRGSEQPWCWLTLCQLSSGSSALLPRPSGSTSFDLWIKVMMKGKVQYNNRQGCGWW